MQNLKQLYKLLYIPVLCILIAYAVGVWTGYRSPTKEIRVMDDILISRTATWNKRQNAYLIELELARIRADIHKRQIRNLQAVIDGLKTIIYKNPKTRNLISKET